MNEERHEEIMNAISNLSAQFSEMLREFKKRGELLHEADDATLSTNDLIDVLGVSKATLNRLRQRRTIPFRYISANQVVYPYRDLVREIMMGRITFKGLSKMNALQRLQAFLETIPLYCDTGAAHHAARAERQPPRQQATSTASCHPSEVPQSKYQQGKACCPHEEEVWHQSETHHARHQPHPLPAVWHTHRQRYRFMEWGDHPIKPGSYRATSSELSRQQRLASVIPHCHKQKFPAAEHSSFMRYIIVSE